MNGASHSGSAPYPDREDSRTSKPSTGELDDLIAKATATYAVKDYNASAEFFSRATEIQADLNGEMSPENADLLYLYGRCLYHVAVRRSDVLGSKVAGEKQDGPSKQSRPLQNSDKPKDSVESEDRVVEESVALIVEENDASTNSPQPSGDQSRPYFQFTGDENFDDSDEEDEEDEQQAEGEEEEDEDDFATAFELLDLARILLSKKLEAAEAEEGKGFGELGNVRQIKERLADTHDLQAEISLEGERFPNAVEDLRAALNLKQQLYPRESSYIAETHYKLSLALEFSSVTKQKDENGETDDDADAQIDEVMREEAAKEMEAAIASCQLRISNEKENLRVETQDGGQPKASQRQIEEVEEMVKDMEQRVRLFRASLHERLLEMY